MQTERGLLLLISIMYGIHVSPVKEWSGTFIFARYKQSHASIYAVLRITTHER
jgi:hypothetical protein